MKTTSIIALVLVASPLAASARLSRTLDEPAPVVAPDLARCVQFALHGHAGVAAAGDQTIIYGDIGGDNAISGFGPAPGPRVHDESVYGVYQSDVSESINCAADKGIAYRAAMAATCSDNAATAVDLKDETLTAGVYCNTEGMFKLTTGGVLTLDAEGDKDAVFIFQAAQTLITSTDTDIVLVNGAQAKNVFWATGAGMSLAGYSTFRGNLLAHSSITMGTGTVLDGRALAGTESVTLAGLNRVCKPELTLAESDGFCL